MTKAGTIGMTVQVKVDGYKTPYKTAPKVNVKVVNTMPKLKLSQTTVTLLENGNDTATVMLLSGDKTPFESGYKVTNITNIVGKNNKAQVYVNYSGGSVIGIKPKSDTVASKALLRVDLDNGKAVNLVLNVKMIKKAAGNSGLTISTKVSSGTANTALETGAKIADIPITMNAANHALSNWYVVKVGNTPGFTGDINGAIQVTPGRNSVELSVKSKTILNQLRLNGKDTKYVLRLGSDSIKDAKGNVKTIAFTLNVTDKTASMSISQKNRIDIANPKSAITATIKLANTGTTIDSVRLLGSGGAASTDFKAENISGLTFTIAAAHSYVVPGVAQKLTVEAKLKNGQTLFSDITVTPAQTGRAFQSKKAITLNKFTPLTGEEVRLGLSAPANVKLGHVQIEQKSLAACKFTSGGFRVVQSGAENCTIYFDGGQAPQVIHPVTLNNNLKGSYTIKLELWAEGTYRLVDPLTGNPTTDKLNGRAEPLGFTDANNKFIPKSKPMTISIRVNIK
jgi:hypothetical protein